MQRMSGRLTSALEMENKSRSGLDTGTLGRNTLGMGSRSNSKRESSTYVYNTDVLLGTDDGLTAEFRHRIGLLPEEEKDLTEAFKTRIGLSSGGGSGSGGDEGSREISEVEMPVDIEKEATLSRYKFSQFMNKYFDPLTLASMGDSGYTREPIKRALLEKSDDIDRMGSVVLSIAIKRFCGDVAIPATRPTVYADGNPVMSVLFASIEMLKQRRLAKNMAVMRINSTDSSHSVDVAAMLKPAGGRRTSIKKLFGSSKKSKGASTEYPQGVVFPATNTNQNTINDAADLADLTRIIPVDNLALAQFIVGLGILRKCLRDEILCQLCCQVASANEVPESCTSGWVLHLLCAGCFLPSQQLLQFYYSFLHDSSSNHSASYNEFAAYIKKMLHRTNQYGVRYHPPNWIEFQAARRRKYVMLPVSLPDGRIQTVEADSAMTASEMCHKISALLGLKDQFGFAIYISIMDKVSSLGNGFDHVMDAISECEQLIRSSGGLEEEAPWQLYFRKEIFTPWHDAQLDPIATGLIYEQIIRSVQAEEFRMRCEEEIIRFVSRRWYIEKGEEITSSLLQASLHEFLPRSLLVGTKSRDGWSQAVVTSFNQMGFAATQFTRAAIKESVVESAQRKWPLHFSGLFESYQVSGPPLTNSKVIIAVGCRGIFFLDEPYRVIMGLHYYEIVDVCYTSSNNNTNRQPKTSVATGYDAASQLVTIVAINGDEWTFVSPNAETITKLLGTFLDGLRRRSRWAVCIQDFVLQDNVQEPSAHCTFRLRQGDVVELKDETKQAHLKDDWMYGSCETTGETGGFPFDCVYIFPTAAKPPREFLAIFSQMSSAHASTLPRTRGAVVLSKDTIGRHSGHGLQSAI